MTIIKASDLEQIDSLKRLRTQLTAGLKKIETLQEGLALADYVKESKGDAEVKPEEIAYQIVQEMMTLRKLSGQFLFRMKGIKEEAMGERVEKSTNGVPPKEEPKVEQEPEIEVPVSQDIPEVNFHEE